MRTLILALAAAALAGCAATDTAALGEKFRQMREMGAASSARLDAQFPDRAPPVSSSCRIVRVSPTVSRADCS